MYAFSLLAYYSFSEYFDEGYCESTLRCFLTVLDKAFKSDGGIGGYLAKLDPDVPAKDFLFRFFYDNIFFIILMIIMLNILLGIIIDQFSTLRENEKNYQEDKNNICFICGFDRETLEKLGNKGYTHHIKEDHNLWKYLFFIAYLREKEETEYTGLESYVAEQLEKQEIGWFPIYKTLSLKDLSAGNDEQGGDQVDQQMETVLTLSMIKNQQELLKDMVKELNQKAIQLEELSKNQK
eukprot:TRINITY_DN931_c0_g1_i2.p2 TRINITY_DN931_c0_g1~~TRINITY_DN931_c0_g1_i2.p2  ORF type:complete len:237 (-),score=42.50 TRINITY_DN931_c0_g1_i2:215-925(-)